MSETAISFVIIVVVAGLLVLGGCEGRDAMRKEAIAHGVAEYRLVSPTNSETEFRWKEAK
jgi:hypothetical protein